MEQSTVQKNNTRYYDLHAKRWAERKTNSFWHEIGFAKFLKHFKNGGRVLDVGCAYGIHIPLFLGIGRRLKYEGMDISSSMLKIALRRYPQLKFYRADITDAKTLPKKKYTGFWAAAVLMHVPKEDWPIMMSNLERMAPGGIGYLTLPIQRPNPASDRDWRHFSFWTPRSFEKFIVPFGWKMLEHGRNLEYNESGWWWTIVRLPRKRK